jgi:hypothetical protein
MIYVLMGRLVTKQTNKTVRAYAETAVYSQWAEIDRLYKKAW